jgi:hypothetical protein
MTNSLFRGLASDRTDSTEQRQSKPRTRSKRNAAATAQSQDLEDGFYWHRIRRMSKKG